MHVDRGNHGPSYVVGLGDYVGGDLRVDDPRATPFAGFSELDNWPNLFGPRPLCGAEPSSKAAITRGDLPPILRFG